MAGEMLVAAPVRWDEACFALPAVRALMAANLTTGVLCHTGQVDLWKTLPGLKVLALPRKSRHAVEMIRGHWQAAILWEKNDASAAILKADVPRRLGPADCGLARKLTHQLVAVPGPLDHRVRYYLAALQEMGIATDQPEFFAPVIAADEKIPGTVLVSPESDHGPSHEWPLEQWQDIGRRLLEAGWKVTMAQARGGRGAIARPLADALGPGVEFLNALEPGNLLPQIAQFPAMLAADGSLPHLAAHLGATCVTIFGPNDPAWRRPIGKRHAVLWQHVECAPCRLSKCPLDHRCMRELDPARVWNAWQEKFPASR